MQADNYTTTDLSLSAFLIARGHRLVRIEGAAHRRQFIFEHGAHSDSARFFLNEPIGARDFASALRQLKVAIHAL